MAVTEENKTADSDGLPADLLDTGGNELVVRMNQLYEKCLDQSMNNDQMYFLTCPKKGDPSI